jgi:ribonuclease BN (tRNA processing enzyme)
MLIDCGFTVPFSLWKISSDPDFIDMIYISHFHADHFFGIPALFVRMKEDGRKKPLVVIGQKGIEQSIIRIVNSAYSGSFNKLSFPVKFFEISENKELKLGALSLNFYKSKHVISNYGVSISFDDISFFYSGDGAITESTEKAILNSTFVVHECYDFDGDNEFHASLKSISEILDKKDEKPDVFLVHINRNQRETVKKNASSLGFFVPEDGKIIGIG